MYKYELKKVIENDKNIYQTLYDNHFSEKAEGVRRYLQTDRMSFYCCAVEKKKIIGSMGIFEREDKNFQFSDLVVHTDHRGQGIATGIIRMAVKFLIEHDAKKIKNHKRENIIPHTVFTEMGFELIEYKPEKIDYKWIYELDVGKADINKLNEIWSEYVS